jgi:hypothetical protein
MDWSFISGFFDGEGAIRVTSRAGSSLLTLGVVICQKSVEVLREIRALLLMEGIFSAIYPYANGMYSLDIIRVESLTRFLRSVKVVVKKRQVRAALEYLEGRITGNKFLNVLEMEHVHHRRKTSPLRTLGPRFPMTRAEALEQSAVKSAKARVEGNQRAFRKRIERRVLRLPPIFGVREIQDVIGVSKPRAQVLGVLMEREGFVKSRFERVPPRFRKKVFERI